MPGKGKSKIGSYLTDEKEKIAEYQRRDGRKVLSNDNLMLVVHAYNPGATHRTIELKVTGHPSISSFAHMANATIAVVSIAVGAEPSGDEIAAWLRESQKNKSAKVTVNMLPAGGWGKA
ncbi:hypothetical protein MMC16_004441 [Acarospora aff. strigata]|nr:hypothetical protein [Acarospora aff. strigata]